MRAQLRRIVDRVWVPRDDAREFGAGPDDDRDVVARRLGNCRAQGQAEILTSLPIWGEHHVPALEVRLDVAVTERLDDRAERGHRDALVRADVDPTEKSDDAHGDSVTETPASIPRSKNQVMAQMR